MTISGLGLNNNNEYDDDDDDNDNNNHHHHYNTMSSTCRLCAGGLTNIIMLYVYFIPQACSN